MNKKNNTPKEKLQARYRELQGIHKWYFRCFAAVASILSFVHVFKIVIYDYVMPDMSYFAVLIAAFVSFTFLIFPATKNAPRDRVPWYDTILAAASLAGPIYLFTTWIFCFSDG